MINLSDLRVRIDQMTEKIVSGLKDRSRYLLNEGVFTEKFYEGKTWFEYRLKREQDLDSEFGRYEFSDQYPLLFEKERLAKPKAERTIAPSDVKAVKIVDVGDKIIGLYKSMLQELCIKGEDKTTYGETVKCDVNNVLLYSERTTGIGRLVAEAKIKECPSILDCKSDEEIRSKLVNPKRETEVINNATEIAKRYELDKPELIQKFFRGLIDLTVYVEVKYIEGVKRLKESENNSKTHVGWGWPKENKRKGTGW